MKKIFCTFMIICLLFALTVSVSATESEPVIETEEITESDNATESESLLEIESEDASDVVDIIANAGSKADAIFAVAEKLGISYEDAEGIVNSVIAVGDKYLGDDAGWIRFKDSVQDNMEIWVIVAVLALVALSMLWYALSNHLKNRRLKTVEFNMSGMSKDVKEVKDKNSQTLEKIVEYAAEMKQKEEEHKEYVEKLVKQIVELKEENIAQDKELIKLQRDMINAEVSNLRMAKLICDRTRMPMADKATIDHYYATGVDPLMSDLPKEEAKQTEELTHTLDTVGGIDG